MGARGRELVFTGDRVSVRDDEEVLEVDGGDGAMAVLTCRVPLSRVCT